ncbi:sensor histidine kinase [Sporosarcina sp. PTS2304]|uniref:sensor histidine kinase n=1 Tax=Sporosarcina sp. PTS2304 TaxID=2283194 RepID=UPI000E0D00B4|nr:sensor histidine kinase [Sporosarcina sp. PTS2304]AXI00155.1 sensor histidine kinase [Sporosarcina sp. PTS2304]
MIRLFIKERFSWILFFVLLQLLVLLIGYLDSSINIRSIMYIVFLSSLFFGLFIVIRYVKETKFYRELETVEMTVDVTNILDARSPFENITHERIVEQQAMYKRQLAKLQISTEQEKDDILHWIHEVKTPLTTMQLMIERMTDASLRRQLLYEWLRIHLLLDQQLHQRRIPFIQNDLSIEKSNLQEILSQEIKSLKNWCLQKGIGFDLTLEAENVLTDAKWLGFICRQLLTNAVKYSDASEIYIKSEKANEMTVLSIQDFGRGIAPQDVPRIFDKGFTSTASHQDHAATGMGLYLAKQVAESLHINIQVQSTIGKGTLFTLTFPKENEWTRLATI